MLMIVSHILFVSLSREQLQLFYKIWVGSLRGPLKGFGRFEFMCKFLAAFGYSEKLSRADRNHQPSDRSCLKLVLFLVHELLLVYFW